MLQEKCKVQVENFGTVLCFLYLFVSFKANIVSLNQRWAMFWSVKLFINSFPNEKYLLNLTLTKLMEN